MRRLCGRRARPLPASASKKKTETGRGALFADSLLQKGAAPGFFCAQKSARAAELKEILSRARLFF
jgi:hypothetical protein